jgi:hypothetical protein
MYKKIQQSFDHLEILKVRCNVVYPGYSVALISGTMGSPVSLPARSAPCCAGGTNGCFTCCPLAGVVIVAPLPV